MESFEEIEKSIIDRMNRINSIPSDTQKIVNAIDQATYILELILKELKSK